MPAIGKRTPPRYQTPLVGRRSEIFAIEASIARAEACCLVGMGGAGKTRLASEALSGRNTCFLDLSGARTASDVARIVLSAAALRVVPPESDLASIAASALGKIEADVLFLDNLEQIEGISALLAAMRAGDPGRPWLLTSRRALGVEGVSEISIPALDVSGEATDAVDLFLRALPQGAPAEIHADRLRVASLVRALEGNPLSIELAAARAALMTLEEIEAGLASPLGLLVDPSRAAGKSSALAACVRWSVDLLPEEGKTLLARCVIFPGAFTEAAARAVCGESCARYLPDLVALHLLRDQDGQLRPYEAIRHLIAAEGSEPRGPLALAHARWVLQESEGLPDEGALWAAEQRLGEDSLWAVLRASAPDAPEDLRALGIRIAQRWYYIHEIRTSRASYVERLRRLLPDPGAPKSDEASAKLALRLASALQDLGRPEEAHELLSRVAARAKEAPWPRVHAGALSHLADIARTSQQFSEMEALLRECLAVARGAGLSDIESQHLLGPLNLLWMHQGRFVEVLDNLQRARSLVEGPYLARIIDLREALVRLDLGQWAQAASLLERIRQGGDLRHHHEMERRLALALHALGSHPRPSAVIAALNEDLPAAIYSNALLGVLSLARLLEGLASPQELEEALRRDPSGKRSTAVGSMLVELSAAVHGRAPGPFEDHRDPVLSSCTAALSIVREHLQGALSVEEALERLARVEPSCWELQYAQRAMRDRAEQLRTITVFEGGVGFDLGAVRREVPHSLQRRLLLALAKDAESVGHGLSAEVLFEAGWGGERIGRDALGNRVRVAITGLRQLGLPIRFRKGLGWSLDAPVVRLAPGNTAATSQG